MFETDAARHFLDDALRQFRKYKSLAEGALAQIAEPDLFRAIGAESNSIALVMKHIAGNMESRWRDFLESDGEKPDRNRDAEFLAEPSETRARTLERWEAGWGRLFGAVEPLKPEDLMRTVRIRGEAHTVMEAITRQLTHYAYHVGQIVFLAKHFAGDRWRSLSIPKGGSGRFDVAKDGSVYSTEEEKGPPAGT